MISKDKLADKVKALREKHKYNKSEMATQLDLTLRTYSKLENGQLPSNIKTLYTLQERFDVDLDEFLELEITY